MSGPGPAGLSSGGEPKITHVVYIRYSIYMEKCVYIVYSTVVIEIRKENSERKRS